MMSKLDGFALVLIVLLYVISSPSTSAFDVVSTNARCKCLRNSSYSLQRSGGCQANKSNLENLVVCIRGARESLEEVLAGE